MGAGILDQVVEMGSNLKSALQVIKDKAEQWSMPSLIGFGIVLFFAVFYILVKLGFQCHWDEWTGRGLFPALAMANGEDLYELKNAPLITSYGPGMALFYLPTALASNPIHSITIAYFLNIVSITCVFWIYFRYVIKYSKIAKSMAYLLGGAAYMAFLVITSVETTTNYIYKIHADCPALFFLISSLLLFRFRLTKNKFRINISIALLISLSFWTKITILPAMFTFLIIPLIAGKYRDSLVNFAYLIGSTISIFLILGLLYDFEDIIFFTFKSAGTFPWSDRNSDLFTGNGNMIVDFAGKLVLLLKLTGLYADKYWHFLLFSIVTTIYNVQRKSYHELIIPLTYFLLIPACLAALAKWGGIDNSLLLCNAIGLVLIIEFLFRAGFHERIVRSQKTYIFCLQLLILILATTPFRVAKSISAKIEDSPQNQAYQYLKKGHSDIYFAWYPISHYFAENTIYSGLEVPTWVGMALPEKINFDQSHFPDNANIIALCKQAPYGKSAIQRSIGRTIRIEDRKTLTNWRLFKIDEK